jgi:sugar (pentulose or hexulose) kinase
MGNYLAFDLGAESCRAIIGNLDDNNKLQIKQYIVLPMA